MPERMTPTEKNGNPLRGSCQRAGWRHTCEENVEGFQTGGLATSLRSLGLEFRTLSETPVIVTFQSLGRVARSAGSATVHPRTVFGRSPETVGLRNEVTCPRALPDFASLRPPRRLAAPPVAHLRCSSRPLTRGRKTLRLRRLRPRRARSRARPHWPVGRSFRKSPRPRICHFPLGRTAESTVR